MEKSGKFSFILIQPQFDTGSLYMGLLSIPALPTHVSKTLPHICSCACMGIIPLPQKEQISTYYKYVILGPRWSPAAPLAIVYFFSSILSPKAVDFCLTLKRLFLIPSPETNKLCFYFSPRSNTCTWKREFAAPSWPVFSSIGEKGTEKHICTYPHSTVNYPLHT